jgi:membrane protease YdiL (CAAX protease family)
MPLWLLGRQRVVALFRARPAGASGVRQRDLLAIVAPPLLGFSVVFPRQIRRASAADVAGSALLAIVNATGEELLWRGVYLALYPDAALLNTLYPSLGFAAWHVAPQSVFPSTRPGGATSLVVTAGLVGGVYARVAQRAGSLRWTTLSHVLFDFSGLGALLYRTDRGRP